ncbi:MULTISPECIES: hydroxyacylglutathione hydrolase [unclassified Acinetobacter]|uniref:hydroxyacylglutathione hydrolase n=1 Tax=unclassified Acinetobacter TaxID=196816 RepID=UPI002447DFDE|nr:MULTISPECIES: hydroxyacylglutathione hydrolase [unclassified Acinetobacter]MDH0032870.1 hydroxyacylglutathione hydrolase [Acinetobacter sp. GD04021]MDH0885729.1 hydroxyacylglutathione hydrolase [Acinetobacter sp. GD03873]MDH1081955.1 hydroxyacylglutathione hydrolase [Acinetobacter sp. GD03983]MDH2189015.1 hydroxyacylglutathione hydrolase [Acinetobacter sp. GD03645]MDH2205208.1 hydroxyacylglutathione hydrolase [Acinetobacter sp. GD03647]
MHYKIHAIDVKNALKNYIWLLEDTITKEVVAIDPTEADLVTAFCEQHQLHLKQIWLTHWHRDHTDGVQGLLAKQNILVYGPRDELTKIAFISNPLQHNDHFLFHNLKVEIIATPGHTLGHIVYFIEEIDTLFCGDTLFAMGCGRLFEGTAEQMYHSLNRLAALPIQTKVYCTHEYTLANGEFALTIEPHNVALHERMKHVRALRETDQITLPSTIKLELETNPFLRTESAEEFAHIRSLKDQF